MQFALPAKYKLFNRYEILEPIGQGGFGITYKALDRLENDLVCVKELFISGNSSRDGSLCVVSQPLGNVDFAYFKRRFLDEANTLNKIKHENIVKVGEYFEVNDTAYMVMDYIKGQNLKDWIEQNGKLNEKEALELFHQLLNAVDAVHKHNILHRDIKPDNIILTPEKKLVLIDFGTAKFNDNAVHNHSTLVVVNHGYAPPEQFSSEKPKGKYTDVYALGATLYFMLTGQKPAPPADRMIDELKSIKAFHAEVSGKTEAAAMKALNLKPSERFQSVQALKEALFNDAKVSDEPTEIKRTLSSGSDQKSDAKRMKLVAVVDYWTRKTEKIWTIILSVIFFSLLSLVFFIRKTYSKENAPIEKFKIEKFKNQRKGSFTDSRDGKTYNWVEIGNQVWMTENLNTEKFRNGDLVPHAKTRDLWEKAGKNAEPAWCYADDDPINGEKYGKLYNWYAVIDPRGLAPEGYHIPSVKEWTNLLVFLGNQNYYIGRSMKSTEGWRENGNGNNESGFLGLPGGSCSSFGNLTGLGTFKSRVGESADWWSSDEEDTERAISWGLYFWDDEFEQRSHFKSVGFSVRCIKDL